MNDQTKARVNGATLAILRGFVVLACSLAEIPDSLSGLYLGKHRTYSGRK